VPAQNLHRVPDAVSDDEAIFTEPLAAALQILTQCRLSPTDRVAVLGDGKLGLLCAQVLSSGSAAQVIAIGKHQSKLAILSSVGIETALVADVGPVRSFDLVVECTGSPTGLAQALSLLRPRGTLVLKSTYAPPSLSVEPHELLAQQAALTSALTQVVIDEIAVQGSRCGPFAPALRFLAERRVSVQPLIAARYPLAQGIAAFHKASTRGTLKVVLTP
jgi:threonine dehydrogenase-like Zn-dependent dehydrogenase